MARLIVCPDRESWLAERQRGIGASEAWMICGLAEEAGAPVRLFAEKLGLLEPEPESQDMLRGRRLEPVVAAMFQDETGLELIDHGRYTIACREDLPMARATLDREVRTPQGAGVLEIKTARHRRQWGSVYGLDVEADAMMVPPKVLVQVRWQLWVTGADFGIVAALLSLDTLRYWLVRPDPEWTAAFESALRWFWPYVERREEPPARGPDDLPIVRLLHEYRGSGAWVDGPGELMQDDEAYVEADAQRRALKAELKHWEGVMDAAEARIRQAMGDARGLILPSGCAWERSARGRLSRRGDR